MEIYHLVLPLIDEDKPKCFICNELFDGMEELKMHHESAHKEFFEKDENSNSEN